MNRRVSRMHAERSPEPRVGKTSVAEGVGDLLADADIPNAVIDLD